MPPKLPDDFPNLPSFDARNFEPPAWAKKSYQRSAKEASSTSSSDVEGAALEQSDGVRASEDGWTGPGSSKDAGVELDAISAVRFTTDELKNLLQRGLSLKNNGNQHFTASPQRLDEARKSYLAAIDTLPECPRPEKAELNVERSGLQEVTEEEAEQIEADRLRPKDTGREDVEADIRDCTKAAWGNLAAVYLAEKEYKQAVEACSNALEIDPSYAKGFHRRALANENIGSWSSLSAAQEDYRNLINILPKNSPQLPSARKALDSLPGRIAVQQEKEKNEMMDKLKELGNGLLGKFGLSTDMFKFDQQAGGGYNMRFQS